MAKQISTQISTQTVHLGQGSDRFEVTVNNLSDRFATFALDLSASGVDRNTSDWYSLKPDLSAKIPAGDQAQFVVNILEVPPVPGGFTGKMNLNVNVTCLELGEEDRQPINLVVGGSGTLPPTVRLNETHFKTTPGTLVEIPLQVYNPNRNSANIRVTVRGLPNAWLADGQERRMSIAAQSYANALFICQPPVSSEAVSGVYPFEIEVSYAKILLVKEMARLEILPTGQVEMTLEAQVEEKEEENAIASTESESSTHYSLTLANHSNVNQTLAMSLNRVDIPWHERLRAMVGRRAPQAAATTRHQLQLSPPDAKLNAGNTVQLDLTLSPRAPWIGWQRRQKFQLRPQGQKTAVEPVSQVVELVAKPRVPFWAQTLTAVGLLLGTALVNHWQAGHRGPVNSVQFDGQANTVISASDDQTIHFWRSSRRLRDVSTFQHSDKSVRVVRYRPRDNNLIAAGLENGEIQLWDFLSRQEPTTFVARRDDRVFDLAFTPDSQHLFSAHGSGDVLRWPIGDRSPTIEPQQRQPFDFAIQSMVLVGPKAETLAVGGRFNQLQLWNFKTNQLTDLDYPAGDGNQYIFDLDVADRKPARLATADNQGRIALWDLTSCLSGEGPCQLSDQWSDGHSEESVNAIALSQDACYLVSGGDDGRVKLWDLNIHGQAIRERQVARFRQPVNSLDIVQQNNTLRIVSGSDDHQVRLHRARANNSACP